ncbi:hypothetical protein [Nocardia sp. NPDC006630]|uniref:hypothetical protein n=1 Tax=Nocardia sp. NPDC006630 TaxID=3157181 RepID=UPI0033A2DEFE
MSEQHSRLFEFPGGVLELQSAGDADEGYAGFHLQFYGCAEAEGRVNEGAIMHWKPACIGYLRTDVSGVAQLWDQSQIRRLAERLGYDFADMVIYDPKFGRPPLARLRAQATRLDAEAVVVPSPEHFEGGEIPAALVLQVDVIVVNPEETYARRSVSQLPQHR